MSAPGHAQLLIVQELDTKLDQLRHRHAHHPIRATLAELADARDRAKAVADAIAVERHDVDRQRKRIDDEVATVRARRADIEKRLYDGSVTATKDLLAMQEESAHLGERQNAMEDDELELMEQIEAIDARLDAGLVEVERIEQQITGTRAELEVALADVEAEERASTQERLTASAEVPAGLLAHYDQLRADMGGIAVARFAGNSCTGCHLGLSAVAADRIKKLPDDAVVTCDSCGRILIR